ncbi:transcriptional repressor TCF25-domain-containing protein [Roridomyces roridus]|uniref:Transcriptional repressor TCF25-domain-containing protein n=1 Tax=Roridomyces roridus TaxID=1738132 RepID=A0AAD7BER3_9AGAR|nr:transcriptional repressor TCF25-domain-containing protein [Roridomyces roridus]
MPPRLNKRQQRELEELEALGTNPHVDSSSDEESGTSPVSQPKSGFAALFTPEDDAQDSPDEGSSATPKSRKKKKKKGAGAAAVPSQAQVAATPQASLVKNEKKAAKKAKARERKAGRDEFDQALAELSLKYPELQNVTSGSADGGASSSSSLASLLSVSLTHLDSEAEMRKFFGSRVIQANKSGAAAASRRPTAQRSNLTRPPQTWFQTLPREGLSLRPLTDAEIGVKLARHSWDRTSDEKWWTVEYSKKYKSVTLAFMTIVYSGDPNGFYNLLHKFPWHGDTLLQLAEVYRHREDYAQAVEFVDRALFSYERAFFGAFNFTTGLNRLDFDHIENRPFFLAVHRQATDLQRRGCVRTAFEFARLLLSLDPANDPHGALFHLDFMAVKTGMAQWLLDMFDLYAARRSQPITKDARADPSILPGWSYARALAIRLNGKSKDSTAGTAELIEAIRAFPSIVPLLADKLDVSLPNTIRSHPDFKIETDGSNLRPPEAALHLLSHLYAQRSFPVWKDEAAWFKSTVTAEFSSLPVSLPVFPRRQDFLSLHENVNLRYSIYRHVMVLETSYRRLFSYIPPAVLNVKTLQCDPLPPPTAVTSYDDAFFEGTADLRTFMPTLTTRQRAQQGRVLAQMIPDAGVRDQLQAFFNAHPAIQERFPEGVVQFANEVAQMDPDEVEALMLAAQMGDVDVGAGEGGGMPGGMPGFPNWEEEEDGGVQPGAPGQQEVVPEVQIEEEEEEEDEEEEPVAPLPIRMLRNVFNRFWGGNAAADDSSSDDEDPVDPAGVD